MDGKERRSPGAVADDGLALKRYVRRALSARVAQGLPAVIEDVETLNRLAHLMSTAAAQSTMEQRRRHLLDRNRPRPGANQSGAGSFSTQHTAGYGEDATPADRGTSFGGAR
jgi:hypothetical protein